MFASLVHGCYALVALSDLQPSVPRSIVSALLCADDEIAAAVHALAVLVYFMTIFAHGHLINPTKQACGHSLEFLSQCRDAIDCPAWMMVGPSCAGLSTTVFGNWYKALSTTGLTDTVTCTTSMLVESL